MRKVRDRRSGGATSARVLPPPSGAGSSVSWPVCWGTAVGSYGGTQRRDSKWYLKRKSPNRSKTFSKTATMTTLLGIHTIKIMHCCWKMEQKLPAWPDWFTEPVWENTSSKRFDYHLWVLHQAPGSMRSSLHRCFFRASSACDQQIHHVHACHAHA